MLCSKPPQTKCKATFNQVYTSARQLGFGGSDLCWAWLALVPHLKMSDPFWINWLPETHSSPGDGRSTRGISGHM